MQRAWLWTCIFVPYSWRIHFPLTTGENYCDQTLTLLLPFFLHIPGVRVTLTRRSGPFHPGALGQLQHFAFSLTQVAWDKTCWYINKTSWSSITSSGGSHSPAGSEGPDMWELKPD